MGEGDGEGDADGRGMFDVDSPRKSGAGEDRALDGASAQAGKDISCRDTGECVLTVVQRGRFLAPRTGCQFGQPVALRLEYRLPSCCGASFGFRVAHRIESCRAGVVVALAGQTNPKLWITSRADLSHVIGIYCSNLSQIRSMSFLCQSEQNTYRGSQVL